MNGTVNKTFYFITAIIFISMMFVVMRTTTTTNTLSKFKPYYADMQNSLQGMFRSFDASANNLPQNISNTMNITDNSTSTSMTQLINDPEVTQKNEVKGYFMEEYNNHLQDIILSPGKTNVGIGCAITTRKAKGISKLATFDVTQLTFYQILIQSFCATASPGYIYNFYISHDHNDLFFSSKGSHTKFQTAFDNVIEKKCKPNNIDKVNLIFVNCPHSKSPAWAQNDAMMQAYMESNDFYYRVTDDARFTSKGWTDLYIKQLASFKPPYVGVVGPTHKGGNTAIMTFDFTHRSHVDIFGFYYPRIFTDWYADSWITKVYKPDRSVKVQAVTLHHTLALGQRYAANHKLGKFKDAEAKKGEKLIQKYVEAIENSEQIEAEKFSVTKVIAMSLYGNQIKYIFGAIRNAQLVRQFFPSWILRVYVSNNPEYKIADNVLEILRRLKTQIIWVDTSIIDFCPSMWRYLVLEDKSVNFFLIRNAETRLSEREATAVGQWVETKKSFYCIRDHQKHTDFPIVPGLWGGIPSEIKTMFIEDDMVDIIKTNSLNNTCSSSTNKQFLTDILWPKVKDNIFCHDSVACMKYPNSQSFPTARMESEYIGQEYDIHEVYKKEKIISVAECNP